MSIDIVFNTAISMKIAPPGQEVTLLEHTNILGSFTPQILYCILAIVSLLCNLKMHVILFCNLVHFQWLVFCHSFLVKRWFPSIEI